MSIQVIMFMGDEKADQAKHTHFITEWSKEAIMELVNKHPYTAARWDMPPAFDETVPDRLWQVDMFRVDRIQLYIIKVSP